MSDAKKKEGRKEGGREWKVRRVKMEMDRKGGKEEVDSSIEGRKRLKMST